MAEPPLQSTYEDSLDDLPLSSVSSPLPARSPSVTGGLIGRPLGKEIKPFFDYDPVRNESKCNILVVRQDADGIQRKIPCGYPYSGL